LPPSQKHSPLEQNKVNKSKISCQNPGHVLKLCPFAAIIPTANHTKELISKQLCNIMGYIEMPVLSPTNINDINVLKKSYEALPWYKKIFFPWVLGLELYKYRNENNSTANALPIYKSLNNTWFVQRRFFSCLTEFFNTPLAHAHRFILKDSLDRLTSTYEVKAQVDFDHMAQSEHPICAAIQIAPQSRNQDFIFYAISMLNTTDLFTGNMGLDNRKYVSQHWVANNFIILHAAGLLSGEHAQANFDKVKNRPLAHGALAALYEAGLLTGKDAQDNLNTLISLLVHNNISIAKNLNELYDLGLLSGPMGQWTFNRFVESPSFERTHLIKCLGLGNLLTLEMGETNFNLARQQEQPNCNHYRLISVINKLRESNLLSVDVAQTNFTSLITNAAILLDNGDIWAKIPHHLFTEARFNRMIEIAQENAGDPIEGRRIINNYVDFEILALNVWTPAGQVPLNKSQSTHTASIHKSVSESAKKLMLRYGSLITGDALVATVKQISSWLRDDSWSNYFQRLNFFSSGDALKTRSAIRCLQRLTAIDYDFIDRGSNVSTKQLLALFWLAIHDNENRIGTLADAKLQLIDALYEIQRGYNLSDTGLDDGLADRFICVAGTFNKLLEKLHSLHPDVNIIFMTREVASFKFQQVVKEEAMAYLSSLRTSADIDTFEGLIHTINDDGNFKPIWDKITAKVSVRMFDEFGTIFGGNKESSDFTEFIATGIFVASGDLGVFNEHMTTVTSNFSQ